MPRGLAGKRGSAAVIPLVVIVGPTAVGKSEVAVGVAGIIGAEIVSGDSMQVYRGMDIGTAKLRPEERKGIPHHLLDIVDPDEEYNVARFQTDAREVIAAIWQRRRLPVLVGGTGLYVRAVIDGYTFGEPGADVELRARLARIARTRGTEALHSELTRLDPVSADRIHRNDQRRLIRALEIFYRTGTPASLQQGRGARSEYDVLFVGLDAPRQEVYARIDRRVDKMIEQGLVCEVGGLLQRGCGTELVSMQGLGYRQIAGYIKGEYDLAEAVRQLKRDTRHFAKRQWTWFRRDARIQWLERGENTSTSGLVERIASIIAGKWDSW